AHHPVVNAAALLVAQRELAVRALVAGRAAGGLIHGPSILVGDPARAVMGDYEGDASSERHHDRAAQCKSPVAHDAFLRSVSRKARIGILPAALTHQASAAFHRRLLRARLRSAGGGFSPSQYFQ